MTLLAILLFTGTMALSLWATMRVRQIHNEFSVSTRKLGINGRRQGITQWHDTIQKETPAYDP
jgi:hypothetical protein